MGTEVNTSNTVQKPSPSTAGGEVESNYTPVIPLSNPNLIVAEQQSNRVVSPEPDPVTVPGSDTTTLVSQQQQPPPQQPQQPESRDVMAEVREQNWAWNGVKRDLAKWAAGNEGKSMTKGDVTISSSTKNSSGVDAQPGYHHITFKKGDTTIELLVHDASGDIRKDAMVVNGVKVKDFSSEVGETLGKLKGMIDAMKAPVAPVQQNTLGNNPAPSTSHDRLKEVLSNNEFMSKFLAEVGGKQPEVLADIASKVTNQSKPEEKVLAMTITAFARDLSGHPVFESGSFSKLGSDVKQVTEKFNELSPAQRKQHLGQWLNAMADYLRVTSDGHLVIEDDKGRQFMMGEDGTVVAVPQDKKLQGLMRIPDNDNGRIVSFLAVRARIVGSYNPQEILGFLSQGR